MGSGEAGESAGGSPAEATASGGFLGSLFAAGEGASKPSGSSSNKQEKEVAQSAELWQQAAAALLILCCGFLVGNDLAPNQQQANEIMLPIVRIIMRHVDPLRRGSADLSDAVLAASLFALYLQAILPEVRTRQAQKKVLYERRKAAIPQRVPIERAPVIATGSHPGSPITGAGAGAGAGPVGVDTAAGSAGSAGRDPIPLRPDVGAAAAGRGGENPRAVPATGEALIEEYLGLRL